MDNKKYISLIDSQLNKYAMRIASQNYIFQQDNIVIHMTKIKKYFSDQTFLLE